MDFKSVSNERKIELLTKRLSSLEEDVFIKLLEAGLDPDTFNEEKFKETFSNMIDDASDKYIRHEAVSTTLDYYYLVKSKIENLKV